MKATISQLEIGLGLFREEHSKTLAALEPLRRPDRIYAQHENLQRQRLERKAQHLEHGFDLMTDMIDPGLGDFVRRSEIHDLGLRRPCIDTITAAIERLRQDEAREAADRECRLGATWPRRFRLKTEVKLDERTEQTAPAGPHVHDGRLVLPGEEVLLDEHQAKAFSTKFEAVE